jgi:hypothetical protein
VKRGIAKAVPFLFTKNILFSEKELLKNQPVFSKTTEKTQVRTVLTVRSSLTCPFFICYPKITYRSG